MLLNRDKDPIGHAVTDYIKGIKNEKLWVYSSIADRDEIAVDYLFRSYMRMPKIEKVALKACFGKVLDVGAAAGSHSLWLNEKGFETTPIDISELAVNSMKERGITSAKCADFYKLTTTKRYDTLLFLMNGIGIAESIHGLKKFFEKCADLLNEKGQVLLDSSDIIYMFENQNERPDNRYYGEVKYIMRYGDVVSDAFNWLFIDFETLSVEAKKYGFKCTKLVDGSHYDYLAKLSLN